MTGREFLLDKANAGALSIPLFRTLYSALGVKANQTFKYNSADDIISAIIVALETATPDQVEKAKSILSVRGMDANAIFNSLIGNTDMNSGAPAAPVPAPVRAAEPQESAAPAIRRAGRPPKPVEVPVPAVQEYGIPETPAAPAIVTSLREIQMKLDTVDGVLADLQKRHEDHSSQIAVLANRLNDMAVCNRALMGMLMAYLASQGVTVSTLEEIKEAGMFYEGPLSEINRK